MADTLVDDFDLVEFFEDLTKRAAEISGASGVGLVLADGQGRVRYMASSNESGRFMELLQLQSSEGPCLDCVSTGRPVVNADLTRAGTTWPTFAPRAAEAGFRSVHAFPMRLRDEVIGALNLFGDASVHFSDDEVRCVQALADVATIAVLQQRALAQAEAVTEQLQGALNSRIVIEQAKGALAQADGVSPAEAFELLRSTARSSQRKIVDVAHDVLDTMQTNRDG
ncbi:MAG: GAF and ANTAR domain-containing protein [Herbiconiux sp.]|nr:GAF and ANTAR domain-containing protein [Herbiconiux sp.]